MIKLKGRVATFTGKDWTLLKQASKELKMTPQNVFTGMLWEYIMKCAREGVFREKTNKS